VLINNPKKGREIGLGLADACPDGAANATCTVSQVGAAAVGAAAEGWLWGSRQLANRPARTGSPFLTPAHGSTHTPTCHPAPPPALSLVTRPVPCHPQVTADNAINPSGITKVVLDKKTFAIPSASKAAILGVWKRATLPDFPAGTIALVIPRTDAAVANSVPKDKSGAARSATSDCVGAYV
jgi:hypothetical protein